MVWGAPGEASRKNQAQNSRTKSGSRRQDQGSRGAGWSSRLEARLAVVHAGPQVVFEFLFRRHENTDSSDQTGQAGSVPKLKMTPFAVVLYGLIVVIQTSG